MPPLRCCLLSGGASQRMGQDKALLPHPDGGTWLERTLLLLAELRVPMATGLETELGNQPMELLHEPAPQEGPLLALHRLMERHPGERLLLCPVDMPCLSLAALHILQAAAAESPNRLHLAHDGERLQPLLGVYPSSAPIRTHLAAAVERGERRLQSWLADQHHQAVLLDPHTIRNVNRPDADQ